MNITVFSQDVFSERVGVVGIEGSRRRPVHGGISGDFTGCDIMPCVIRSYREDYRANDFSGGINEVDVWGNASVLSHMGLHVLDFNGLFRDVGAAGIAVHGCRVETGGGSVCRGRSITTCAHGC